ncbi:MAG: endonuclease [Bacteroidota bacterium]|nr:endonuclease [Bacteroidota bacterium]
MKYIFCFLFLLAVTNSGFSQLLDFNPSLADFGVVYSKDSQTRIIKVSNQTAKTLIIYKTQLFTQHFYTSDSAFVLPPYGEKSIAIGFSPLHNIIHASELFFHIQGHGTYSLHLYGQGRYKEKYYDSTENLHEEALKTSLKNILTKNYNSLGYNSARDNMYMQFDNGKNNGSGDTVNTLECVYTGRVIKSYANRQDAQTNYNFNTEHTWPQSLFSSQEPMLSDLHHLFPVDENANSTRSNNPFGVVTNPQWQQGGSKSISELFEPKDSHKGRGARALLYFAIRYQNYNSFLTAQENILRQWNTQYIPTQKDSLRNEAIYKLQKNRNPFIDHPELANRITSISKFSNTPYNDSFYIFDSAINLSGNLQDTLLYTITATGLGNQTLLFTNIKTNLFAKNVAAISCDAGFAGSLNLKYICNTSGVFIDTIVMDCSHNTIKNILVPVKITVLPNSIYNSSTSYNISIYPNPARHHINIDLKNNIGKSIMKLYNITGQQILETILYNSMNTVDLPSVSGMYYIEIFTHDGVIKQKVVVE